MEATAATATTDDALAPERDTSSAQSPAQSTAAAESDRDSGDDAPVVYELQRSPSSQLRLRLPLQQQQEEEEDVAPEELQLRDARSLPTDADADAAQQSPTNEASDANHVERASEADDDDVIVVASARDPTVTSDRATEDASGATPAAAPPRETSAAELQMLHAAATAFALSDAQRKRLDDELQCILCHDTLFKPVTATCGHSFCRVCLLDSCLSRAIAEAQCPICRADVMRHFAESPTSIAFNVNVTLWNVIQLLVPAREHRESQQEDDEYAHKLDQLTAKWRIHTLQTSADRFHRTNANAAHDDDDDGDSVNDDDYDDGDAWLDGDHGGWDDEASESDDDDLSFATDEERRRHRRARRRRQRARRREHVRLQNRYPQLKVEHTVDGRLRVARNVVLDTDDANDDGVQTMRVSLALVEFPSIVERYSEHQECSLAVLKMEEDEEIDSGFPFFMNEGGDDDALVVTTFYNHVTLKVFDDGGNNVLERTRAARQGIVDFPELRLDVPAGNYTFHFSDDLYGMYLTVKTTLSELTDVSDAPLQEQGYASYVADEAADTSRERGRQRQREWTASDEEDAMLADGDDAGHDSDDSFIVNGDEDDDAHGVTGAFSGDEGGDDRSREGEEAAWSVHSDDEDAEEAAAAQHVARRNRHRSRRPGVWDDDDDDDDDDDACGGTELSVHDMTGSEGSSSDDGAVDGRHRHVVELVSQETDAALDHTVADDDDGIEDEAQMRRRPTGSRRVVLDSDDDDDDDDLNADGAPAPLLAEDAAVAGRTPPQPADREDVQRPQTKRRARTVVLSEDDDDDDDETTRFPPHKRRKTSARLDVSDDLDDDDLDDDADERYDDRAEDDTPSFTRPPQWFDDGRDERRGDVVDERDDDAASDDETRRLDPYHDYGDERASDDDAGRSEDEGDPRAYDDDADDGWQQEQDHQFEEEHYGDSGYGDDRDDDGGGGWY